MSKTDRLIQLIPKLDIITFTGLARLLRVELITEVNPDATDVKDRYAPRPFHEVLDDLLKNYESSNRQRRREILQIVKAAAVKDTEDADNS